MVARHANGGIARALIDGGRLVEQPGYLLAGLDVIGHACRQYLRVAPQDGVAAVISVPASWSTSPERRDHQARGL